MSTYLEIKQQIEALQKQAESLKASERAGVIERMREAIAVYDITAPELGFGDGGNGKKSASRKGIGGRPRATTPSARYSDGKGNIWGGRGPRPAWLKEALASGAKLEDFASSRSTS